MVVALTRSRGDEIVSTGGPVSNLRAWEAVVDNRIDWTLDELRAMSDGLELPLMASSVYAELYKKILANGQPFREAVDGTNFRPWTEFHGTNDRKAGILKEDGKGWPVYKGDNYDLWVPEQGEPPFTVDPKQGLAELQRRRLRSEVWRGFSPAALHDKNTLPPNQCHVLFRDITNRLNNRTVIACLVPPRRFAINSTPVLLCINGGYRELALRLGIMCSIVFDWTARRRVERHLNYYILNALPVPRVGLSDARARRVAQIAAGLAAQDTRFADFANDCGVPIMPRDEMLEERLAELDALVSALFGLNEQELNTVFSDFSEAAVSLRGVPRHVATYRSIHRA